MALFGSKTKTKKDVNKTTDTAVEKKSTKKTTVASISTTLVSMDKAAVIVCPHITEKSGILSQSNVYTFVVTKEANKPMIAQAVKALYKVTPTKITVVNLPSKNVFVRGKKGVVSGMRKAVVTLKKGDKIDFV
jgi:large subunit ribosomal protein L23